MLSGHAELVILPPAAPFTAAARQRFQQMFEAHHETVWRMLRRRGFEGELAADLTQQAFLIAAERLGDIRLGSERAFLLETGLRLARTASRKLNRMQLEEDMDLRGGAVQRADDALDQRRAVDLIDRILATLTPDLLEVFLLFEMEDVPVREIARMVGIPVGTAASRLRRAREAFRAEVARIERPTGNRRGQ